MNEVFDIVYGLWLILFFAGALFTAYSILSPWINYMAWRENPLYFYEEGEEKAFIKEYLKENIIKMVLCFIVGIVLFVLTAWSYNRCQNLPYSINDYTYSIKKFSDSGNNEFYKTDGSCIKVLIRNDDGNYKEESVPSDTVEYHFSDSKEAGIAIYKKEYN